jgi:hypothetical protein
MKVLQDLLDVTAVRVKKAEESYSLSDNEVAENYTLGRLAAAARAYADVATAVATHKHTLAEYAADTARSAMNSATVMPSPLTVELAADHVKTADELMREAEDAELVALAAKDRAKQLEDM